MVRIPNNTFVVFIAIFPFFLVQRRTKEQKGADLTRPHERHREAPWREARKAAPGWARALGDSLRKNSRFPREIVARATLNFCSSVYIVARKSALLPENGMSNKTFLAVDSRWASHTRRAGRPTIQPFPCCAHSGCQPSILGS
jgi:hypothetical protein